LLILGVVYWAVEYLITSLPIPDPFAKLIRIALVVLFALIIIALLLGLLGKPIGLDLPRLG
jgi:hypothetical protein